MTEPQTAYVRNAPRSIGHYLSLIDQPRGKKANKPTLSKREANATPIEFRDELLKLAAHGGWLDV